MIPLQEISRVADITRYQARLEGDRIAQFFEGRETSYLELDRRASQIANGLIAAGCTPGTHIGYVGKNSDYYFEVMTGAAKANVVIAAVNWRLATSPVSPAAVSRLV